MHEWSTRHSHKIEHFGRLLEPLKYHSDLTITNKINL